MTVLKPKTFIQEALIDEVDKMKDGFPYFSFIIMSIGIEFLGKCIDSKLNSWDVTGRSKKDFEQAINQLNALNPYRQYLSKYDLYGSFRCGLAHKVSPKVKITLSSKEERGHLIEHDGRLNFKVEDFYNDFYDACKEVIEMTFPAGDKMNDDFMEVPGTGFNSGTNIQGAVTSSIAPATGESK